VTGLCICGKHDNIHIVSEGDEIYMEYNNLHSNYGFKAYYAIAPPDQNTSIICDKDSCFEKNGKYYEKVNKTYKAFSYTLVPKETLILYRTNNSFEEHFVPSDEDYYNGSSNRYNETIF
uniref:Serine/threonine protein kinase n=1 Tax=Parastrongyloides trichosuri TaxID=131310 RepID=A0A0N4ZZS8_PARTI